MFSYSSNVFAGVLLNQDNFQYIGSFRLPKGGLGGESASSATLAGSGLLGINEDDNTLYVFGSNSEKVVTEITIPEPVNSSNVSSLNTASVVRSPADLSSGNYNNLKADGTPIANGGKPGGLLLYNDRLIGSSWAYYDGAYEAALSHFSASKNWNVAKNTTSMQGLGSPLYGDVNGGFVGGWMCKIPTKWQLALGGKAITGKGAISVIGRSSLGPSAWAFDPDDVGTVSGTVTAVPLITYTLDHPTLGVYAGPSLYYNMGTDITGVIFPNDSDSVLFFGVHGLGFTGMGDGCYGPYTNIISEHGRQQPELCMGMEIEGTKTCCYDPVSAADDMSHAYPYQSQIWAYKAEDMKAVKDGVKEPWEIIPYAIWGFDLPFSTDKKEVKGAVYNNITKRLYITSSGESVGYDTYPIVNVYKLVLTGQLTLLPGQAKQTTGTGRFIQ